MTTNKAQQFNKTFIETNMIKSLLEKFRRYLSAKDRARYEAMYAATFHKHNLETNGQ